MKSCALRNLQLFINFIRTEIVMFFCNFCELFLLIFILSYVIFQSFWILLFIGLGILGLIYNLQDLLVYHPQEPPESKFYIEPPSLYNLPYEVIQLKTADGVTLHSYLMLQNQHMSIHVPTVVLFHGNAGNIGQRLLIAQYLYVYCQCNVFMVEYRGYGFSQGFPCEKGFYKDAESSIDHLLSRSDVNKDKIIAFGQSIGGAVVIDLALKYNDKLFAFIVENTFTSLPDIGRDLFSNIPGVTLLPDLIFKNQYQSLRKVKHITMPGLFISGQGDQMIPPAMMKQLFDKANCSLKRLLKIDEANHNNTWIYPGYFQFISKFVQEVTLSQINNTENAATIKSTQNVQIWHVTTQNSRPNH